MDKSVSLTVVVPDESLNDRITWKSLCAKLAKSFRIAHRDYHKKILRHDAYARSPMVKCKTCGYEVRIGVIEVHMQITGQSLEEAQHFFNKLEQDRLARSAQWRAEYDALPECPSCHIKVTEYDQGFCRRCTRLAVKRLEANNGRSNVKRSIED